MATTARQLTDAEYDRIAALLNRFHSEHSMNLEMLDGFFVALICSPEMVPPSEYLPQIWGGNSAENGVMSDPKEWETVLALVMNHWNAVAHALNSGGPYLPLLLEDNDGVAHANDWAHGFLRGMELRRSGWSELFDDEAQAGTLVPIFALANEHHADPEMRPYQEPMTAERREQLIVSVAGFVPAIFQYFATHRRFAGRAGLENRTHRRANAKTGRNDLCPCGSGEKFKKCCGKTTVH